jgi:GNAT superfamily N-acetyltransferase
MRAKEFTNFTYKTEPYEGWNGDGLVVRAYDGSTEVGHVIFEPTEDDDTQWYAVDVEVEEPYQRKGIASKMYDIAKKSATQQGAIIVKSHTQTDAGRGLWQDKLVWEAETNKTTLNNIYGKHFPDRDEEFWDYVSHRELGQALTVETMPKHKVSIMLLSQYRAEHIDDITDMLDDDQQEIVQSYINDPALSSKIVIVANNRIIDGNHRALASAIKGVPINYVDLAELDEEPIDINEALSVDVPNEEWLQDAIDYAKSKSPDRNGLPYMGKTTATARRVDVPVDILRQIPGMRREQSNVRHNDLAAIMKIMNTTGKLPLGSHTGEEYKPFINVAYDGSAWVNEGNHRIMAAAKLGWDTLPIEISYFDGGERIKSGPMYPPKIGL